MTLDCYLFCWPPRAQDTLPHQRHKQSGLCDARAVNGCAPSRVTRARALTGPRNLPRVAVPARAVKTLLVPLSNCHSQPWGLVAHVRTLSIMALIGPWVAGLNCY